LQIDRRRQSGDNNEKLTQKTVQKPRLALFCKVET
jgi:hypothetical protein